MKTSIICLRIAGAFCALFVFSHSMFGKMFKWDTTLACLSQFNRAIMLTYHYLVILMLAFMAIVSIFQAKKIMESSIRNSILLLFAAFYTLRIVTEFTLFGFSGANSVFIIFLCFVPLVLFLCPIFLKANIHKP